MTKCVSYAGICVSEFEFHEVGFDFADFDTGETLVCAAVYQAIAAGTASPVMKLMQFQCCILFAKQGPSNIVSIESEEQFNTSLRKVQDESLPAIFYFTAVWCGPCRLLSPVIGQLSEKYPHVTTYKIDIDKIISTVSIAINSKISNQKHTHLPLHPNWQMYTEYPCSHVFTRSLLSQ
ncbi:Thioredoxin O2, mitochondrial [Capsicum annuum]|nr:Thioredoxin O2, mitochondrial [Capsicum annuum]